jgi:vacuolar-type H+-ATPase subunit D/Vma8
MSGSTNRYQVPPTVTVLTMMKARLVGATKGHALLKKKADALTVRYRQILKEIVEAKQVGGADHEIWRCGLAVARACLCRVCDDSTTLFLGQI